MAPRWTLQSRWNEPRGLHVCLNERCCPPWNTYVGARRGLFPALWPSTAVWHAVAISVEPFILLKNSHLSSDICLPDFRGKGGSNKYKAINIYEAKQCPLLIFSCWVEIRWFVIKIDEWLMNGERCRGWWVFLFEENLIFFFVWKKLAKYLCRASLGKQTGLHGLAQSAGHHFS